MDREKVKVIGRKVIKALKVFIICSIILTVMEFAIELTNSEPLPENFLRVYKVIYPRHVDTSLTEMIFFNYVVRLMFRDHDYDSKPHCFCDLIYDIQVTKNDKLRDIEWIGRVVDLEYGFGLEKY